MSTTTAQPCLLCKHRGSAFSAVFCSNDRLAAPPASIEQLLAVRECAGFVEEPEPTAQDWVVEGTKFLVSERGL